MSVIESLDWREQGYKTLILSAKMLVLKRTITEKKLCKTKQRIVDKTAHEQRDELQAQVIHSFSYVSSRIVYILCFYITQGYNICQCQADVERKSVREKKDVQCSSGVPVLHLLTPLLFKGGYIPRDR